MSAVTDDGSRSDGKGPLVVLLHGFMGESADLEPFSRSLGIAASFAFPRGIVDLAPRGLRGRSWWPLDVEERAAALSRGARDLSGFVPEGLAEARAFLDQQLDQLSSGEDERSRPLVIGGFSQGAMLACDLVLRTSRAVAGVVVFSGARIAAEEWKPRYETRRGLPIFVSHGRKDDDLSFSAAEAFQQELSASGWLVTWCPFDGRHEIPIVVWRSFRRWLSSIPGRAT
jgi:phospholipase/carboxylesterase